METRLRDSAISLEGIFGRCKLRPGSREQCDSFAQSVSKALVQPVLFQGYCSYTLLAGDDTIIQFRPLQHAIDVDIAEDACRIFGLLAPRTQRLGELRDLGLVAYSLTKIPGVSLQDLRAQGQNSSLTSSGRERLVQDFAQVQALSWKHSVPHHDVKHKKLVGGSLRWRLETMQRGLSHRFQPFVNSVIADIESIEALPWALSHGDLLPANIMVCPESSRLQGLIDWAEAEYLPFGVGMYGLEELIAEHADGRFTYHDDVERLRELFWDSLVSACPELKTDPKQLLLVKKAQMLGVLLWHGIAFDDGALDRACEQGQDDEELAKLDAFFTNMPLHRYERVQAKRMTGRKAKTAATIRRRLFNDPLRFFRGLLSA